MPISYARLLSLGGAGAEERFRAKFAERFPPAVRAIPIGRARSGVYLLTQLAVRDRRRKVLLSPFTIPDLVTMVILAGGDPEFYDFEPGSTAASLDGLATQIDDETACVFITHYHVNEPNLDAIAELCRRRGAYLFDDCAITFGGSIDGRPLGTVTDASVFSFSSFKLLNFFWGGMVTTRDPVLAEQIEAIVGRWPRLGIRDYAAPAKACLKYDVASRPPFFDRLVFPRFRRKAEASNDARSVEHVRIETESLDSTLTSRPSLAAFAEWLPKLDRIDAWLAQRRSIAGIYRRQLGRHMVSSGTSDARLEGACFVNFPVIVPEDRCGEIGRAMMRAGFDVGRSLYPNAHRHPKFTSVPGHSENVDRLVRSTIYLPTHFAITETYANEIAAALARRIG